MTNETPGSLIDDDRSACLCDVGAPRYVAALCVTAAGDEVLWLVSRDDLGRDDATFGDADQRHERLGRLPQAVRDRIWGGDLRCGRARSNGQPCRMRVKMPGQACVVHSTRAAP